MVLTQSFRHILALISGNSSSNFLGHRAIFCIFCRRIYTSFVLYTANLWGEGRSPPCPCSRVQEEEGVCQMSILLNKPYLEHSLWMAPFPKLEKSLLLNKKYLIIAISVLVRYPATNFKFTCEIISIVELQSIQLFNIHKLFEYSIC